MKMPGSSRTRRLVLSIALGGGLALGAAGLAQAADPTPGQPSQSGQAGQPGRPADGRGEPRVRQPHLSGTVKSIADGRIMIVDRDGFTRQINFAGQPEGVAVGTRIVAVGKVNADGVSLDATEVKVAPERAAGEGKRGGFGHRGGDRPAGPGKPGGGTGPAPSGSASPAPSASAGS